MLQVKTESGFQIPSNIFYKNGQDGFLQVKKVFVNEQALERIVICSCQSELSELVKSLHSLLATYKSLTTYATGDELAEANLKIAEITNEIESVKIEQVLINQQLTIIDNERQLKNEVKPLAYAINTITRYVIDNTNVPQIVVKMVPGANTVNPDISFSPLPDNMFKYEGNYYYIGNQVDQETILSDITNVFGEGKVALEVKTANQMLDILRPNLKSSAETNISQLSKIILQQSILDTMITARKQKVNIDPSLQTEYTDNFLKDFYGVTDIMNIGTTVSTTIVMNASLKRDNLIPATKIDTSSALFPFVISSLNDKTDDILGIINTVSNVSVSSVISKTTPTQIYSSSDVHEFDFKKLIKASTGVYVKSDGTLTENMYEESYIISEVSSKVFDLSTLSSSVGSIEYADREIVITAIYDSTLTMTSTVKLSANPHDLIISVMSDVVESTLSSTVKTNSDIPEIISVFTTEYMNLAENVKLSSDIEYILSEQVNKIEQYALEGVALISPLNYIISEKEDVSFDLQSFTIGSGGYHPTVISPVANEIHNLSETVKTSVNHPELIALVPDYDITIDLQEYVNVTPDIHKYNVSEKDNTVHDLQENVFTVNDPIPFTVYQQSVKLNRLDVTLDKVSIDSFGVVVKNVGSISRLNPISILSSKVPNYISTQTNADVMIEYNLNDTSTTGIDSYIVSQLNTTVVNRLSPIVVSRAIDTYIAESKSVNVINFGEYSDLSANVVNVVQTRDNVVSLGTISAGSFALTDNYIISQKSDNVIEFGGVSTIINDSESVQKVADVKFVNTVSFLTTDGLVVNDSIRSQRVADVKFVNTVSFLTTDGLVVNDSISVQKVSDVKDVQVVSFGDVIDVDLNIGAVGSPFKVDNGIEVIATGISIPVVLRDTVSSVKYSIYRDSNNMIQMDSTSETETSNNYFYDETAKKMYKLVSSDGYLDIVQM